MSAQAGLGEFIAPARRIVEACGSVNRRCINQTLGFNFFLNNAFTYRDYQEGMTVMWLSYTPDKTVANSGEAATIN